MKCYLKPSMDFGGLFYFTTMKRLTTDKFIEKARIVHGDLYDYHQVNYVNARSNIEIIM